MLNWYCIVILIIPPPFSNSKEDSPQLPHLIYYSKLCFLHCGSDVYNALTVHGLCRASPLPGSVLELDRFWAHTAYNIGGHEFSLDDIEHGILRGDECFCCFLLNYVIKCFCITCTCTSSVY